jgi:hypothetical protein
MIPKHILARAWHRAGVLAERLKELEGRAEALRDDIADYEGKDIDHVVGQRIMEAHSYMGQARECLEQVEYLLGENLE